MKISLNWLGDFLAGELAATKLADALTHGGLPVEGIETHGGDTVLDVEVTSNRSDCLSHIGVARELSALLPLTFGRKKPVAAESNSAARDAIRVSIEAGELCPQYTARLIRGVKIGPSPDWIAKRLEAVGVRPINNVVDVTNYVMLELGQPLHAFDFAKIEGGQIIVRTARKGENLISIDGRQRELTDSMLVIADARKPVALAGVMGGSQSEVTPGTADLLLESARFDPLSIRRTARALAMKSDSSYRFERGVDPLLAPIASLRAAQLILEMAGGQLTTGMVEAGRPASPAIRISLRISRLKQVLGVELPVDRVVHAFDRLGFAPIAHPDRIDITVPSHRLDVTQEIDLVEEAARVIGYEKIPTRKEISIQLAAPQPANVTQQAICQALVAGGYFEAVTFSFVSDALRTDFGDARLRADASVRKADASLRPSLLPGLLQAVRFNESNGVGGANLFEVGSTFALGPNAKVDERRKVAWVGGENLRETRGVVEAILKRLDADRPVKIVPGHHAGFSTGACGKVVWGDREIGFVGKIDRKVIDKLSLRQSPTAAELELSPLLEGHRHVPQLHELPKFPAVRRDLSLIVAESVRFETIESLVRELKLPFLEELEFVTAYRGKPLEPGTKSVTIALVFRSPTATLTSEEVETSVQKAVAAAKERVGATVRA